MRQDRYHCYISWMINKVSVVNKRSVEIYKNKGCGITLRPQALLASFGTKASPVVLIFD